MKKVLLSGVLALVAYCRIASGGEGTALPSSPESLSNLVRLFSEIGLSGVVGVYLYLRERRDAAQAIHDRQQKINDNERWHALDRELMTLVRECTSAITANTNILNELRKDVWRLMRKSSGHKSGSDTDVFHADSTRMRRKD